MQPNSHVECPDIVGVRATNFSKCSVLFVYMLFFSAMCGMYVAISQLVFKVFFQSTLVLLVVRFANPPVMGQLPTPPTIVVTIRLHFPMRQVPL